MDRYKKAAQNRAKASLLNKSWGVGAAQARYRETGNWYHTLNRFPAALFDSHGYLVFLTEDALRASPYIQLGKQISVPGGISGIPGYVRMIASDASPTFHTDEVQTPDSFWEGAVRRITVNAFERDEAARRACIAHFGTACSVCRFDFGAIYGELGTGFIHVHHTRQLRDIRVGYAVDPKRDLVPVCPNCHAMLHQTSPPLTIAELQERLHNATGNASFPPHLNLGKGSP
jgi:predicted HNH restriction endonuclease